MALATVQITMTVQIRPLAEEDYGRNFIEVLEQLSRVGPIDRAFFRARLDTLRNNPRQLMIVAEDASLHRICGTGTLVMEPKMIRSAGLTGHLEDLVVDQGLRKKGIGRAIVNQLVHMAHVAGCYKVIIDCSLIKYRQIGSSIIINFVSLAYLTICCHASSQGCYNENKPYMSEY